MDTAEVIVVGAGPAGLAAAVTLASEGRPPILLERRSVAGGQAGTTSAIENYIPFPGGISGKELIANSCAQCRKFGVDIRYNVDVRGIIPNCDSYTLDTSAGFFHGRVVLLAMGLDSKPLNVPGSDLPGIHLGMDMEAMDEVEGKRVVLIGGGNSAGQAACHYTKSGAHVTLIVRRDLRETMSAYLVDRIAHEAEVVRGAVLSFKKQNDTLDIELASGYTIDAHCVHVFIGQQPSTDWIRGFIQLDGSGYIVTDHTYRTSLPGIFAVGDCTHDAVRRVGSAVGDGNRVVPEIHKLLDGSFHACYLDI